MKRSPRVEALGRLVLVYLATDWEKFASSEAGCWEEISQGEQVLASKRVFNMALKKKEEEIYMIF